MLRCYMFLPLLNILIVLLMFCKRYWRSLDKMASKYTTCAGISLVWRGGGFINVSFHLDGKKKSRTTFPSLPSICGTDLRFVTAAPHGAWCPFILMLILSSRLQDTCSIPVVPGEGGHFLCCVSWLEVEPLGLIHTSLYFLDKDKERS